MANRVTPARVVLVPVRGDLDDGWNRFQLRTRWQPEMSREPGTLGERNPEVFDLPDGGFRVRPCRDGHTCSIGGGADGSTPARGIHPDVWPGTEAAKRNIVNRRLAIYLNDHLAGSVVGTELAKRALRENRGSSFGEFLEWLLGQILEDRATLERLMAALGVSESRLKRALALALERVGRLKLNGQLTGYSPLSRLVELEGLVLGVTGKRALWIAMQEIAGTEPRLLEFDFDELRRRAEEQLAGLEGLRIEAARLALAAPGPA